MKWLSAWQLGWPCDPALTNEISAQVCWAIPEECECFPGRSGRQAGTSFPPALKALGFGKGESPQKEAQSGQSWYAELPNQSQQRPESAYFFERISTDWLKTWSKSAFFCYLQSDGLLLKFIFMGPGSGAPGSAHTL